MNEPVDKSDDFDPGLEALFRRTHAELADGAFVASTTRRVQARQARLRLGRRLAEAGALIAIVLASPWLIEGSVRLSAMLDEGVSLASAWLATPTGVAIGVACAVAAIALRPFAALLAPLLPFRAARRR